MCSPSLHIPLWPPNPREPPCAPDAYSKHGSSGGPGSSEKHQPPAPRHPPLPVSHPTPEELSLLSDRPFASAPRSHLLASAALGAVCSALLGSRCRGKNATWVVWCNAAPAIRRCRGRRHRAHLTEEETERVPGIPSRPMRITASLFKSKVWVSQNFLCCPRFPK